MAPDISAGEHLLFAKCFDELPGTRVGLSLKEQIVGEQVLFIAKIEFDTSLEAIQPVLECWIA